MSKRKGRFKGFDWEPQIANLVSALMDLLGLKIISGGQTGVDRAALDFAIEHGMPHGGWCPRGRHAEDGIISPQYDLRETPSRSYRQRTQWNVRDSDATVAFTIAPRLSGGTALAMQCAQRLGKPSLHLSHDALAAPGDGGIGDVAAQKLLLFLNEHQVQSLNVAGPRASQEPEVADFVRQVFRSAMRA
jgi:hypothetical protein